MLFNSLNFAIFLLIVFLLYWFATKRDPSIQNILLVISSFFFYACWDWRFMFLLIFSIVLDYLMAIKICNNVNSRKKKYYLWLSIGANLGFLGIFKYYNFFAESFISSLSLIGFTANLGSLQIILPVGISFYTFHGLSYIIDVYKERIKPEKSFINYALFVSFFPLLVAGPIERATHLLPQIIKKREFNYDQAVDGLKQILWGLFKKVVVADNCAEYANTIFNNSANFSGSTLVVGAFFFTVQIYCDFSGYSDIALGVARLFGIELLRNFSFPYFSRDIAEFWRRWHISLSSWFKDYLYIPLGGSKGGSWMKMRNTLIIFLVSGFWHGANWTFVVWGLLNALYIMPSIILNTNRNNIEIVAKGRLLPSFKDLLSIGFTFSLTVFAWIFFRASNLTHALSYVSTIFSKSLFIIPNEVFIFKSIIILIILLFVIEWLGREQQHALARIATKWNRPLRWGFYMLIVLVICKYAGRDQQFVYFQF